MARITTTKHNSRDKVGQSLSIDYIQIGNMLMIRSGGESKRNQNGGDNDYAIDAKGKRKLITSTQQQVLETVKLLFVTVSFSMYTS